MRKLIGENWAGRLPIEADGFARDASGTTRQRGSI
jgi:hypothetical protein